MVDVRRLLFDQLSPIIDDRVGVALSGGVDSTAIAIALKRLGKRVVALSFRLSDRTPGDWTRASTTADTFGFEFVDVELPTDVRVLEADVRELVGRGLRKKTAIECSWPMTYLIRAAKANCLRTVVTGSCADGHFGLSKKAMMHYRQTTELLDVFRASLFGDPDYAQVASLTRYAESIGVALHAPYRAQPFVDAFRGLSWPSINKPRQKQPIWDAFKELGEATLFRHHVNLQLGDSGIAEHFMKLLELGIAPGAKSPVAVYNRMARDANADRRRSAGTGERSDAADRRTSRAPAGELQRSFLD